VRGFSHPGFLFVVGEWLNANLSLLLEKEFNGPAHQNSEMAEETKGMENCISRFICCWTALLCSRFLFQPFFGKLELVEDASLYCFQFHHLFSGLVRTGKVKFHLFPAGISFGISGSYNHVYLFLFV